MVEAVSGSILWVGGMKDKLGLLNQTPTGRLPVAETLLSEAEGLLS